MTPANQDKIDRFTERIPADLTDHWNEILDIIEAEHFLPEPSPDDRLMQRVLCLEAICLMHGITDLNLWLAKGPGYLENQAREFMDRGVVQVAEKMREYV